MTPTEKPAAIVGGTDRREVEKMVAPQERELYRLAIPWDPHRTSLNARFAHRGMRGIKERHSEELEAQELAILFWRLDRWKAAGKVLLQLYVLRGTRLDTDNATTGCKALLDGLCKAKRHNGEGLVDDDDPGHMEIERVNQVILPQFKHAAWVVVVVRAAEA